MGRRHACLLHDVVVCGAAAAGFGQLAATNTDRVGGWLVLVTIGAVLLACAAVIVWRVPPALSRVLPG